MVRISLVEVNKIRDADDFGVIEGHQVSELQHFLSRAAGVKDSALLIEEAIK